MKKIQKLLYLLLAIVITLVTFIACNKSGEQTETPETDEGTITIADFENWAPDFQLIRLLNNFGVVTRNSDSNYVTSGKYSAKLQPMGTHFSTLEPMMYFPLQSELFDFNYADFTKTEKISVNIYNAEEIAKNVEFGLVSIIKKESAIEKQMLKNITLKPGWNEIDYNINRSLINIVVDLSSVKGIYFSFENARVIEVKDAPVYYMDDLKITYNLQAEAIEDIITLDPGEIMDFEKIYQKYAVTAESEKQECMPQINIVQASNHDITPVSGDKVLQVLTNPGSSKDATWPRIIVPEKIMCKSDVVKVAEDDYENTYLTFSVYNKSDTSFTFFPEFYAKSRTQFKAFSMVALPRQWSVFKVSFADVGVERLSDPGIFAIAWGEYSQQISYEFFFDNIKIIEE